jgi:hypothetical protein
LIASVLKEYLEEFIGDVNYSYSIIEPETLAYFNGLMAGLGTDSSGQVLIAPVIEYIKNSEPEHRDVLCLNDTILETLIVPHACFPFSHNVPLTRDAFCRAIILLTNHCKTVLGQGSVGATEVILRETSPRQRLFFIFSALVHPPTGEASYDDLLSVVSRLSYPARVNRFKNVKSHRSLAQLAPLAQRLEPGKPTTVALRPLPIEVLKPLEKLVAVFPPERLEEGQNSDRSFRDVREVSVEEFVDWGERVRNKQCQKFWASLTRIRLIYSLLSTECIPSFSPTGTGNRPLVERWEME